MKSPSQETRQLSGENNTKEDVLGTQGCNFKGEDLQMQEEVGGRGSYPLFRTMLILKFRQIKLNKGGRHLKRFSRSEMRDPINWP